MRSFVGADEICQIKSHLESLFDRFEDLPSDQARDLDESPREAGEPPRNPEITQCLTLDDQLAGSSYLDRVRAAAGQLLGGDADLGFDHAIRKPPAYGTGTAWHQDAAYDQVRGLYNRLSFWLPLQPVSAAQGCMQFLPGTQAEGYQEHYPVAGSTGGHTLTTDVPDDAEPVTCEMQLGDLVVHHPLCLHFTGPNTTDQPRLAWILIFQKLIEQKRPGRLRRSISKARFNRG